MGLKEKVKVLNNDLANYTQATLNNDINTILEYTYPAIFNLIAREDMQVQLEEAMNSEQAPKITKLTTTIDQPLQNFSNGEYTTILADTSMVMKSPYPENSELNEILVTTLKTQMGENSSVAYDTEKCVFNIKKTGQIVAIQEGDKGWKFVDYQTAMNASAEEQLLPEEIAQALFTKKIYPKVKVESEEKPFSLADYDIEGNYIEESSDSISSLLDIEEMHISCLLYTSPSPRD